MESDVGIVLSSAVNLQVQQLLANTSKKNQKACVNELKQLLTTFGTDVLVYALYLALKDLANPGSGSSPTLKQSIVQSFVQGFGEKQKLPLLLLRAVSAIQKPPEGFLQSVLKMLKLPLDSELHLLIGLCSAVLDAQQAEAMALLKGRLETLGTNKEALTLPLSTFHSLLSFVQLWPSVFSEEEEAALLEVIKKAHPTSGTSSLMFPLLQKSRASHVIPVADAAPSRLTKRSSSSSLSTKMRGAVGVAELMEDLGYASAATPENLKVVLAQFPALKPSDVARIIGMMSRTHTGLDESAMLHTFSKNSTWNAKPGLKTWNVNVFVDTVKELYPKLNWQTVIQSLDHPEFQLNDSRGFGLILAAYRRASKAPFPVDALFGVWSNTSVQLSILKLAVAAPPDAFSFFCIPPPNQLEAFPHSIKVSINSQIQHWFCVPLIQTLLSLSEIENYALVRLIFDHALKNCPELLFLGLAQIKRRNALHVELCDQLMAIFLANHANSAWVLTRVWNRNSENQQDQAHRHIIVRGMVQAFNRDPSVLPKLLDISQMILKSLTTILQSRPYSFSLALATLAKHREFLSLGRWLPQRIQESGEEFVAACIQFVSQKVGSKSDNFFTAEILGIFLKSIAAHIESMPASLQETFAQLQRTIASAAESAAATAPPPGLVAGAGGNVLPGVMSGMPGGASLQGPGQAVLGSQQLGAAGAATGQREVFPAHIERRANTLFQQIYTGQVSIDEAIRMLQSFKDSNNENHDVFACMLHSLFDEFRFFASYPDKELNITGILFGKLILHQLISHVPLGIAFRYVLEALRKPSSSKMFKFGVLALDQFKTRLGEWPQYCAFLSQIPQLRQAQPKLMEWVDRAKGSAEAMAHASADGSGVGVPGAPSVALSDPAIVSVAAPGPSTGVGVVVQAPPSSTAPATGAVPQQSEGVVPTPPKAVKAEKPALSGSNSFSTLPLDLLLASATPIVEPPEKVKDRIHFIFNNVSISNLSQKAKEMRELLLDEHEPYLARYIVVKRAAIEPNFQQLYVSFMDALASVLPHLLDAVLAETYRNVRILLDSEDIASSSAQRTILKNLGSWLGRITIGKDRPLLYKDLCPKKLILSAYETGKLIVVVPFVAKILAAAAESHVFKPPNAWTMAQLRVLIELYNLPDLKLILKFETEVLCNHLSVDQSEIRPTQLFVNRPEASAVAANPTAGASVNQNDRIVHNLDSFIRIPPTATLLIQAPPLQRFVAPAIDASIREIIQPVVERSVTIACITTRELVTLDFATEAGEDRLRQAARMMVRALAGSLAGVTCAEPLRISMSNHLRSLLQANVSLNKDQAGPMIEQAVTNVVQENLELACALIEKTATERALKEVEEALASAVALRQNHNQTSKGKPFVDASFVEISPTIVPPALRPSAWGLSPAEYHVYEDYSRLPLTFDRFRVMPELNMEALAALARVPDARGPPNGDAQQSTQQGQAPQQSQQPSSTSSTATSSSSQPGFVNPSDGTSVAQPQQGVVEGGVSPRGVIEAFKTVVQELDKIFVGFGDGPINMLPQAEITNLVRQIPHLIVQSGENAPQYAVTFAQVLFTRLFENSSPIFQEIQLVCLKGIRDVANQVTKDITMWVTMLSEEHSHNYKAILGLIRFQLIQISVYDAHLAKMLVNGTQKTLELAIFLIKNCCVEGRYAATMAAEFSRTIGVLRTAQGIEGLPQMLEQIARNQAHEDDPSIASSSLREDTISQQLREKITAFFSQWVHTLLESDRKDPETCLAILRSIGRSNPELASIINAQNLPHLVHLCTSSVVQTAYQVTQPGGSTTAWYKYVDSLTPLLVLLVRHAQPGEDLVMPRGESPAKLLIRRLTVVLNVIVKMIIRDHARGPEFRQRVHYRILVSLLVMLNAAMSVPGSEESDEIKALRLQTALVFSDALMLLSPTRLPGFVFAWLELLSHRAILPTLLLSPRREVGWPQYQKLLVELLRFMQPYLRSGELADPIRFLYRGMLRLLLVLLHDFPEFLAEYYVGLCDYVPQTCVQLRNLILSACPRNVQQPDPFQQELMIDRLPAIQLAPSIRSDFLATLSRYPAYAKALNVHLTGKPSTFMRDARAVLEVEDPDSTWISIQCVVDQLNCPFVWNHRCPTASCDSRCCIPAVTPTLVGDI